MSTFEMKSRHGQTVVAVDNAEDLGEVKHFVVSPKADRIERIHVDGRKKKAQFVEWGNLESFGADRVMVHRHDDVTGSGDERDIDAAKGDVDLIGTRVLTTAGFEEGSVDDAVVDAETGEVLSIRTTEGRDIEIASVHSLGSYALVVDPRQ